MQGQMLWDKGLQIRVQVLGFSLGILCLVLGPSVKVDLWVRISIHSWSIQWSYLECK